MAEFFAFAVDKRLAPRWLPFGVRPGKDGVTPTDARTFLATFGFLKLETPLANINEALRVRAGRCSSKPRRPTPGRRLDLCAP